MDERIPTGLALFQMMGHDDSDVMLFEQHRKEYIEIIRELRKKHPNLDMKSLEEMAEYEVRRWCVSFSTASFVVCESDSLAH